MIYILLGFDCKFQILIMFLRNFCWRGWLSATGSSTNSASSWKGSNVWLGASWNSSHVRLGCESCVWVYRGCENDGETGSSNKKEIQRAWGNFML